MNTVRVKFSKPKEKMNYYFIKLLLLIFMLCGPSHSFEYKGACRTNDIDLEDCLGKELKEYDSKLNQLYKESSNFRNYKKLRNAERKWIQFKEEDCDYMASSVTMGRECQSIYTACLINKTKERIADFKRSYFFAEWFNKND